MIELKEVSKGFGGKAVLENISLRFAERQTHVLLGASGSGKSTLLRLLLGLTEPDSGKIVVREEIATLGGRAGYVVQEGGLFPHLDAKENVALPARARGWTRERCDKRVEELRELAQLDKAMMRRYPQELSGGQRQRVGLMRAMMLDPDFYVLDEPLGALDPMVRADLQRELKRIFNALSKTVILVTHDLGEAAFFGHTISLLDRGRVAQQGSFSELVHQPASPFVTEFIHAVKPPPEMRELL